jgi:hypothetical protein
MSPACWVLFGLCAVLAVPGLWALVADADGEMGWAGWAVLLGGASVTCWAVLQSLWRPDEQAGIVMAALWRTMTVPFVTWLPLAVLYAGIGLVPAVRERFQQHQLADAYYSHEWFPVEEHSLVGWLGLYGLIGLLTALLTGLAVSVAVVIPVTAFWKPEQMIRDNMMSNSEEHRAANTAAVRGIALLVPLIFVVVGLLVGAENGSFWWWLGIVLIPAGLALTYLVWSRQRVDHGERARWGGAFRGIPNPDDAPPPGTGR